MVSFRRCILALAVLSLFAGLASAQIIGGGGSTSGSMNCLMTSIPTTLRAEGATELVGDIRLECSGGPVPTSGAAVPNATVIVNLSAPVTSRLLGNGPTGASESLLLIDEPGSGLPGADPVQTVVPAGTIQNYVVGTSASGVEACTDVTCSAGVSNVFQGIVPLNGAAPSTQVVFQNVPILAPGTAGATRVFRITNVRVDANFLGVSSLSAFGAGSVMATVSITNNVNSLTPATVTVGNANPGLTTSVQNTSGGNGSIASLSFLQCGSQGSSTAPSAGGVLRYTSNFAGAFKTRTAPTATNTGLFYSPTGYQNFPGLQNTYSESGFIVPVTGSNTPAGLADFGTRLKAVFHNVPAGVNVYVTTSNVNALGSSYTLGTANAPTLGITNVVAGSNVPLALLVLSETVPDFIGGVQSPFSSLTVNGASLIPVTLDNTGSGQAVWEMVQGTMQGGQSLDFGVYFQYTVSATSAPLSTTPGTVSMSYAPTPSSPTGGTTFLPSALTLPTSGPIPRFADTSTPKDIISIGVCQTVLLFPYVTNTFGFETGLSIANTSTDTLGTTAQTGTCSLSFYGNDVISGAATTYTQAAVTTAAVPSGGVWADTLSNATGGATGTFSGYMIATCNFQFAHGFAFISDSHATNLAEGYLALVVTDPGASSIHRKKALGGESLNQ